MFHLVQPIWMLAATGIIIPVVIHLWNVRQGKILKVGSIAFLTQSSKNYANSVKLTELLLLILRCLLILLLAVLLAKPRWNQPFKNARQKGWVLIEKGNVREAYTRFKPLIDSLITAGYEFHYFNEGFKKENLPQAIKDTNNAIFQRRLSYPILLKQLNQLVPAELRVYLFTTNYLNRFAGNRQAMPLNLHWHTYTPADSIAVFISKAYSISADSIRIVTGKSTRSGTIYNSAEIDIKNITNPDLHISDKDKRLMIAYRNNQPVAVDTAALNVTVFTGKYTADATYIKAAVEAVQQFSRHEIRLLMVKNIEAIPSTQDWLFWFSEQAVPQTVKAGNIFKYQDGDVKNTISWINTTAAISGNEEKIALYKLIAAAPVADRTQQIWQDGFGNTVLSLNPDGYNLYQLFTHLDPSWNDLPWSSKFPQLIFSLLYPGEKSTVADSSDKRTIGEKQLQQFITRKDIDSAKQKFIITDISPLCWLVAFILFCIERFIALRTRKEVING